MKNSYPAIAIAAPNYERESSFYNSANLCRRSVWVRFEFVGSPCHTAILSTSLPRQRHSRAGGKGLAMFARVAPRLPLGLVRLSNKKLVLRCAKAIYLQR